MSYTDLFPSYSEEEVWERVHRWWDIENYTFPIPKFEPECVQPPCRSNDVTLKRYDLHKSDDRTIPCRMDVVMKCCQCGSVLPAFGVPIPEARYLNIRKNHKSLRWVGALALMVEHGEISMDSLSEACQKRVEAKLDG